MSCDKNCENKRENVPYIVHEADMSRMERTNKRLWIVVIALIGVLLGTNGAWLWYESQFEYATEETVQHVNQNAENGENSFIGGDSYYGTSNNNN